MQQYVDEDKLNHKGTVTLYTDRFTLRKFQMDDAHEIFCNWSNDKDSAKYNAWSIHLSENVTKEYLSGWIQCYKKSSYYHWAIVDNNSGEVIGSISVSNVKNKKKYCEIGYTVAKKRWNEGIATEVLIHVLEFLVNEIGFNTVRAIHDIRNEASGRVMRKAGMVYVKNKMQIFLSGNNIIMKCCVYDFKKY